MCVKEMKIVLSVSASMFCSMSVNFSMELWGNCSKDVCVQFHVRG